MLVLLLTDSFLFTLLSDTLDAYIDKYGSMVPFLSPDASGSPQSDPASPDQTGKAISLRVCNILI